MLRLGFVFAWLILVATGVRANESAGVHDARNGFADDAAGGARANGTLSAGIVPLDIIPTPTRVVPRDGVFVLGPTTHIILPHNPRAERVAHYFDDLLQKTRQVHLKWAPPAKGESSSGAIVFRLDPPVPGVSPEAYAIDISPQRVIVSAGDSRGLFYGAVTLWQLSTPDGTGDDAAVAGARASSLKVPGTPTSGADALRSKPSGVNVQSSIKLHALTLNDGPRLKWRGLMLDSARHYQSPQFILQFIDWMALHKLNIFQWHLTDDQGWRLEIKKYPRLTAVGAWRVPAGPAAAADIDPATGRPRLYGGFYTQDEVRGIVAYAAKRNITVVPEIDMPGHASAAVVAYPKLGVLDARASLSTGLPQPLTAVPADWGIFSNLYNVEDSTFDFLDDVLDEVLSLFPGEYIHVGGDEAAKDQWKASARIQQRMRGLHLADEQALQSYFIQRIEKHLHARGRRLVGWDEILEGGLAANATVMSWHGIVGAVKAVGAGHDAILSPWPTLYFDNRQGTGPDEPPGRGRVLSLHEVYDFDPLPADIAPDRQKHILGLQANIWTEHIRTEDRVAYMTFPRAAAVAETGWSPAETHNWNDFVRRLPGEFARYRAVGLRYSDDSLRSADAVPKLGPFDRYPSQDLQTCTDKLVLSLEDDAPVRGKRAIFLIDVMNPCWILPAADLSKGPSVRAAVGQVPFNFQIGKDRDAIQLAPPHSADGELEVFLDSCTDGKLIASLSLTPAVTDNAVTQLSAKRLPATSGRRDLCFRFTQRALDPLWALDWVQLRE